MILLIIRMRTLGSREQLSLSAASLITLFGTVIQAATDGAILLSLPFGSAGYFVPVGLEAVEIGLFSGVILNLIIFAF